MAEGQLAFGFTHLPSLHAESFFVSDANRAAHAWVAGWPDWPAHALILSGPQGSGKTHLARMWQERTGAHEATPEAIASVPPTELFGQAEALLVEAFERAEAEALLHLINHTRERGGFLLLTTALPPQSWPFSLPDLTSRLNAMPRAALETPDDALLTAVLTKLFADRQLRAPQEVVAWLAAHIERSFAAAAAAVETIDRAALSEGRNITLALAQKAMRT